MSKITSPKIPTMEIAYNETVRRIKKRLSFRPLANAALFRFLIIQFNIVFILVR